MSNELSIRDTAIKEWCDYIIECHTHRYNFGSGKSFYTALFEAPKIFRRNIVFSIIDIANSCDLNDIDNIELKDVKETAISFIKERNWEGRIMKRVSKNDK
jgi:hypothetical protein